MACSWSDIFKKQIWSHESLLMPFKCSPSLLEHGLQVSAWCDPCWCFSLIVVLLPIAPVSQGILTCLAVSYMCPYILLLSCLLPHGTLTQASLSAQSFFSPVPSYLILISYFLIWIILNRYFISLFLYCCFPFFLIRAPSPSPARPDSSHPQSHVP